MQDKVTATWVSTATVQKPWQNNEALMPFHLQANS